MPDSAVHVEGVVKRFRATTALAGVDLDVEEATVFGLLGPNGAGKTTLVRVLATLLAPDAGRAEVFGRDVVRDAAGVRELLGLAGQFAAVDEMLTGRENLQMFGRLFDLSAADARRRANELLERFDLADAADRPARTYSGGMRRRLDLASSLLTRPRVLFLDEPTTGLDPRSRNEIWSVVHELVREGTTIMLTTQYLEEADQLADQIAVIDHGRMIAQGTGSELKDRVGGQILEVELVSAAERDNARAALAGIGCGEPEPGERLAQLTLPAPRAGLEMIEDAASALRKAEIAVSDLGLRRPTLDDVFLQLTGAPSENGAGTEVATSDGQPDRTGLSVRAARARAALRPVARRPPRWRRVSPRELRADVTDAWVVSGRNLRHFVRQPDLLIFSTIQPIMFVLLFTYVFGGAISHSLPPGVSYIDYLLPGILVQSVTFRASMTAVGLSDDLKLGVIDRFRSMPMARSAVLIGRTAADFVRNVLIIVLMIIVGYIIGFRFQAGVAQALACIALVSAFGLALSWIFAFVALTVRSAEAAQSAGFVILFPLVFASSVFVPFDPADLAAGSREGQPGHPRRERSALPGPRPRNTILPRRRNRLDRRSVGSVHPAVRVALQANDLTPPAINGNGEVGEWLGVRAERSRQIEREALRFWVSKNAAARRCLSRLRMPVWRLAASIVSVILRCWLSSMSSQPSKRSKCPLTVTRPQKCGT
jgi:daunorubicin resistance ABC transporter ATP-binding subunit